MSFKNDSMKRPTYDTIRDEKICKIFDEITNRVQYFKMFYLSQWITYGKITDQGLKERNDYLGFYIIIAFRDCGIDSHPILKRKNNEMQNGWIAFCEFLNRYDEEKIVSQVGNKIIANEITNGRL